MRPNGGRSPTGKIDCQRACLEKITVKRDALESIEECEKFPGKERVKCQIPGAEVGTELTEDNRVKK